MISVALQHWRDWQEPPARQPVILTTLSGGCSHHSVLVGCGPQRYVIKCLNPAAQQLLPAATRFSTALAAPLSRAGLAPALLWHNPQLQVSRYIEGESWPDRASAAQRALLAHTLRRLHDLPVPAAAPRMDMRAHLHGYQQRLASLNSHCPALAAQQPAIARSLDWLQDHPAPPVLCHQDVHPGNLLLGHSQPGDSLPGNSFPDNSFPGSPLQSNPPLNSAQLFLLDWEYAGVNDRHMDLACVVEYCDCSGTQLQEFVHHYGAARVDARRLHHFRLLLRYTECLWWLLQDPQCRHNPAGHATYQRALQALRQQLAAPTTVAISRSNAP